MNMHQLTALRPTHPVAWLAALGCLRVLTRGADPDARLSWGEGATPWAQVRTVLSREELFEALTAAWRQQAQQKAPVVLDADSERRLTLPPRERLMSLPDKHDTGRNDPAKITLEEYPRWAEAAGRYDDPAEAVAWLRAIGSDLRAGDDRHPPIISMTRFYLLSRQQRLAQQFESLYPRDRNFDLRRYIDSALTAWARVSHGSGMNWDLDGNQNAAEAPDGTSHQVVVPGAIWLATMAMPLFPVGGSPRGLLTRSWVEPRRVRRGGGPWLVIVAWKPELDLPAIEVLLDHPWLSLDVNDGRPQLSVDFDRLEDLGVTGVYACPQVAREVGGQREHFLGKAEPVAMADNPRQ